MSKTLLLGLSLLLVSGNLLSQSEYVPSDHPVYHYLLRQSMAGRIGGFEWSMLPLARHEVAAFLDSLGRMPADRAVLGVDKDLLAQYALEFSYDIRSNLDRSSSLLSDGDFKEIVSDDHRHYLYAYADSLSAIFIDGIGSLTRRVTRGDSLGHGAATLGELGIRFRGTLGHHLGFSLQAVNGALMSGSHSVAVLDHRLLANRKFNEDERTFYDLTTGYLRYDADWISVMAGRDQLMWGPGYVERLVFSDNTVPFDFFRLDFRSKSVHYSFLHGSLVGADSLGHTLPSKYIAAHRLEFSASRYIQIAFSEAVIYANQPMNFALANPFTFMTSAELSTELANSSDDAHNSLMWVDVTVKPMEGVRAYGSLLIDDLKFSAIGKNDIGANTNKFAWQGGVQWNDPWGSRGVLLTAEYTRVNPFVLTHWTNTASYTNWNLSLGPSLPPNSDQWLIGADVDAGSRLALSGKVRFRRGGKNIVDANGKVIFDAGANITHGENQLVHPNVFLEGLRVNTTIVEAGIVWRPLLQYFVRVDGRMISTSYPVSGHSSSDLDLRMQIGVDY